MAFDKKTKHEHPSYGMVQFVRTGGSSRRLFGSGLNHHSATILLTVREGVRHHELGRDWYMGNRALVEVELSAAQFTSLLTQMNVGTGVPCTIRRYNGEVAEPPDEPPETERVRNYFKYSMEELAERLKTVATTITDTLGKKSVTKK